MRKRLQAHVCAAGELFGTETVSSEMILQMRENGFHDLQLVAQAAAKNHQNGGLSLFAFEMVRLEADIGVSFELLAEQLFIYVFIVHGRHAPFRS